MSYLVKASVKDITISWPYIESRNDVIKSIYILDSYYMGISNGYRRPLGKYLGSSIARQIRHALIIRSQVE
jgi:hypothetical protein